MGIFRATKRRAFPRAGATHFVLSSGVSGDINITANDLNVSISHTNDSVLVYGNDGSNDQKIKTDSSGTVQTNVTSSTLPSGASTSANQTIANSSLSSIDSKIPALGQKTSANSLPITISSDQPSIKVNQSTVVPTKSLNNSTTILLAGGAIFQGTSDDVTNFITTDITVISDQNSATDGLLLEWSQDNVIWNYSETFTLTANSGRFFSLHARAQYFRLSYTNSAMAQSMFGISTFHYPVDRSTYIQNINKSLEPDRAVEVIKSVLAAKVSNSPEYLNVVCTPNAILQTDISASNIPINASTSSNQISELAKLDILHSDNVTIESKLDSLHNDLSAVEVNQNVEKSVLSSIDSKTIHSDTNNVTISSSVLPTDASTSSKQDTGNISLSSIDSKIPTIGQKPMANSVPVVVSNNQSPIQSYIGRFKRSLDW